MGHFLLARHPIKASSTDTRIAPPGTRTASTGTGIASTGIKIASTGTGIASTSTRSAAAGTDGTNGTNGSPSVGGPEVFREYCTALGIDPEKGVTSFDDRVRKEYTFHTAQYWLVASLANGLLWAQIVIGAALTALGATRTHASQTATIYLGAASTIIAGLLTYFKSRNQPNRARQFRQSLRAVRNRIDDTVGDLQDATPEQARALAKDIMKQYKDALTDAETNYPDEWMTLAALKKFLPGDDSSDESGSNKSKPTGIKTTKTDHHHQAGGHDITTGTKIASNGKGASSASDTESPESTNIASNGRAVPIASETETLATETPEAGAERTVAHS